MNRRPPTPFTYAPGYSTSGRRKQTPAKRPRTPVIFCGKSVVYAGRTAGGGAGDDKGVCSGRRCNAVEPDARCEDDEKSRSSRAGLCRMRRNRAARVPPLFPPAKRPAFSHPPPCPTKRQRRRGYDGVERLTRRGWRGKWGGAAIPPGYGSDQTGRVRKPFDVFFLLLNFPRPFPLSFGESLPVIAGIIKRPKNGLKKMT